MKTQLQNITIADIIKGALALVIIAMGAVGYTRFFDSQAVGSTIWLMIALFVTIEIAILYITTKAFSDALTHTNGMKIYIGIGLLVMWAVATTGIDQTIWGMVEDKYNSVKVEKSLIKADEQREKWLQTELSKLETQNIQLQEEVKNLETLKQQATKLYDKKERKFRTVVYNFGAMCTNVDCIARKEAAQNALDLAKNEIDGYNQNLKTLREQISYNQTQSIKLKEQINTIISARTAFDKVHSVTLDNKHEESLIHEPIMHFFNFFGLNITTPERAYVLLISMVVYPIYILFVAFLGYNTPQKRKMREELMRNKKANNYISNILKKVVIYLIKTRRRKVAFKEVEVVKEVEVEKVVYKDGKEIVKVEIEVPKIIEKPVIVEKTVEVPIIEKEFVIVPESIDLNELNKIAKTGSIPKNLKDLIEEISDTKTAKFTGVNYDKYRAA